MASLIDPEFVRAWCIPTVPKKHPRPVEGVDGKPLATPTITHETVPLTIKIGDHKETLVFDVAKLGHYPIVLGVPWLKLHNPAINWSAQTMTFPSQHCRLHCQVPIPDIPALPEHPYLPSPPSCAKVAGIKPEEGHRRSARNETSLPASPTPKSTPRGKNRTRTPYVKPPQELNTDFPTGPKEPLKEPDVAIIGAAAFRQAQKQGGTTYVVTLAEVSTSKEEKPVVHEVPVEYHEYLDLFSKEEADKLPPHRTYDHEIPLEEGKTPPHGPIYKLSEEELAALRKHLEENLRKGFIAHSTSPAGAPILFIRKKTGKLRLCIDYRGLNAITVKNRYPLPLIGESLDRLRQAKVFTKLDLRGAYNLVRIKPGEEWKTAFRTR